MKNLPFLQRFLIRGLHYYKDFDMTFDSQIKILVGENGVGKTSVLNILFAILKKHWFLIAGAGFNSVLLEFANGEYVEFSKSELDGFILFKYQNIKSLSYLKERFDKISKVIDNSVDKDVIYIPAFRNLPYDLNRLGRGLDNLESAEIGFEASKDRQEVEKELLIPLNFDDLLTFKGQQLAYASIHLFMQLCNNYLVNTRVIYNEAKESFLIINKDDESIVSTGQLSSGEKQIMYVFLRIFLKSFKSFYLLIDEPELHVSIIWQKKFLVDIINTGRCLFLFSATQSPFIFDNSLDRYAQSINTNINLKYASS